MPYTKKEKIEAIKDMDKGIKRAGLIKSEIALTKQSGVDYQRRASADMQYIRYGTTYTQCEKCKGFLGLWHCVRSAMFKPRGKRYMIRCKQCGHENWRIKGALREELDDHWLEKPPAKE